MVLVFKDRYETRDNKFYVKQWDSFFCDSGCDLKVPSGFLWYVKL